MSCHMKSYVCLGLSWKEVIQCGLELIFSCGWFMSLYLEQEGRASWRFGTSFGSFGPLQLIARGGNLSDVMFIQLYRKLVCR